MGHCRPVRRSRRRARRRRVLRPVAQASAAAHALAEGLLETRLPVETDDEFGAWAAWFNEMAQALEGKIHALSEAQARERRFTSDVAHELRTPVTALAGEASLLAEHLERMPVETQRPAQLLVDDVSRLRRLVEELMEISRLDAGREDVRTEPVALDSLTARVLGARLGRKGVARRGARARGDGSPSGGAHPLQPDRERSRPRRSRRRGAHRARRELRVRGGAGSGPGNRG